MTDRYLCIHGHFYQPPRENAWLEAVEVQDSAYPYHDWNARINAECYAANAYSRIMDDEGRIQRIVNNYARISFNFGPTLLSWMAEGAPDVYQSILDADAESRKRFHGHGAAMAQAYNHMIMPLANRRDKYTQVKWGIEDFEHRFGRHPEGMWLPETAVDIETLDIMAELGIHFTILSPTQADRVRPLDDPTESAWTDVSDNTIDPTMPYLQRLPSGRTIALFFYDGPISHAVAFEKLLQNGETFADRLTSGFSAERQRPQILHIASDGETYGHHQRHGDMALAYALEQIETNELARITNYSEYLEIHPPTHEVEIIENTAWSCSHGVERWRSDCGCHSGGHPQWNQAWRTPLREALDWLRDTAAPDYELALGKILKDPWAARDDYIRVILDRFPDNLDRFFRRHAARRTQEKDRTRALKLLEMQRNLMLMYTSCGWFFDELSGIETVQVIQYAGRAIQLYGDIFGSDIEARFLDRLEAAKSNMPEHGDGRHIYEKFVRPAMVDLRKVAVHFASSSLFEDYADTTSLFCYTARQRRAKTAVAGKTKLTIGETTITSEITRESADFRYGALHLGDHTLSCALLEGFDGDGYYDMRTLAFEAFNRGDFTEVYEVLDNYFSAPFYSMSSLFRDEQRKILDSVVSSSLEDALSVYHHLYDHNAPLVRFLRNTNTPCPKAIYVAGELAVNSDLNQELSRDDLDMDAIQGLLETADLSGIELDARTLEYTLRNTLERLAETFDETPGDLTLLERVKTGVELVYALPFDVNLRKVQNLFYYQLEHAFADYRERARKGDQAAEDWTTSFTDLGEKLRIRLS
jgi:alpha-amylase/alpha-mannosidase (GH57 family)